MTNSKYIHILVVLAILLIYGCDNSKNDVFTNEPDGFREYKWGIGVSDIPNLKSGRSVAHEIGLFPYTSYKANEKLEIDGITLLEIEYLFKNNLFGGVLITIPSKPEFERMKAYCFKTFGNCNNIGTSSDSEIFKWEGKVARIVLNSSPDNNKDYGYLIIQSMSVGTPRFEPDSESTSYIINGMRSFIQMNKDISCMFSSNDNSFPVENKKFDLCKLFKMADEMTNGVFRHIKESKYVKPDYYYFSVFLEDYGNEYETYSETLYEENEIGLFENLDECNKVSQYALSNDIPIRKCRSWKSYTDYRMEDLMKYFNQ